jgi:hypothetical protein
MGKWEWEVVPLDESGEPFIGPPKPESCTKGWQSHTWDLDLMEGSMGLSTKECRLCNDGVQDVLYPEDLNGEFPVRLSFHHEVVGYFNPEYEAWWIVAPAADDEVKRLQAVVDAVDALHQPEVWRGPLDDSEVYCSQCSTDWPCATYLLVHPEGSNHD